MKRIVGISITLVTLVAVLSISLSFVPESHAGTGPSIFLDFDLGAICDTTNNTGGNLGLTIASPGDPAIGSFTIQNVGTATEEVSVDIGDTTTGGFRDEGDNTLHILPSDVTVDAVDTTADIIAAGNLANDATPLIIANLDPLTSVNEGSTARTINISVATDNIQNPPAAGPQGGTLNLTLACFDSEVFIEPEE